MERETRDKFVATTDQDDLAYGESGCLETPPALFGKLHEEFRFDVDLCANEQNHLLPTWYGPGCPISKGGEDALTCSWGYEGHDGDKPYAGFCNPPYGAFITKTLNKAVFAATHEEVLSVFLLPMRAGGWYKNLVLPYADEVRHCARRVTFYYQGVPKPTWSKKQGKFIITSALFDSIVVVYRPVPKYRDLLHPSPHFSVWDWK